MSLARAYLDYNASAPLTQDALAAASAALAFCGNASSVHHEGREARRIIEQARKDVAALVNADPSHVIFTSGATEAASMLLTPSWKMGAAPLHVSHLYVCAADHPCMLNGGHFATEQVTRIEVDADGLLRLDMLENALAAHDKVQGLPLVACHLANNETGVIQDSPAIAAVAKAHGALLVLDAVQAAGRIPLDMVALGADFLVLSAHKIGGPKGAGAIVSQGEVLTPVPLVKGGGQEKGHRAGTENVMAIAGFGAAARNALDNLVHADEVGVLRNRFEAAIVSRFNNAIIFGAQAPRLPNTLFFSVPGLKAETAQIAFDLDGVALSAGSACSSGKVGPSHVLAAMGVEGDLGALRVSIGCETGERELQAFEKVLDRLVKRHIPSQAAE
ncbi:cysteine desulfurase family protein [Limoniibacter endophyticus]|uniref:Cysteine desulfurase n=1 Tax=Limoniibacter endophyticus TaxID=1565040 RepID=A0A8J3GGV9_9HYPH|nr:cysteine desulfurase family protein [Limoniibacter endophyticus]GHC62578.1 cysteine desulfurase [Limoniibacter endophyticus]